MNLEEFNETSVLERPIGSEEAMHIIAAAIIKPREDKVNEFENYYPVEIEIIYTEMSEYDTVIIKKLSLLISKRINLDFGSLEIVHRYLYDKTSKINPYLATLLEKFNTKIFEYDDKSYKETNKRFNEYNNRYKNLINCTKFTFYDVDSE